MKKIIIGVVVLVLLGIIGHAFYLWSLGAKETYPEDNFLQTVKNKSALILVAHDDDAVGCAGTIAKLKQAGWHINFVCYYGHANPAEIPVRKVEMRQSGQLQGLNQVSLVDFEMMNRPDTIKQPWDPFPYEQFSLVFKEDSIRYQVGQAINQHKPTVIFTLDEVMGSTGNPAHIALSKAITEVCRANQGKPDFPVQKIYQITYPPSLQNSILNKNEGFKTAKAIYQVQGMPSPDVEINITDAADVKKSVMEAHASQHRSLRKIWPYYNWYPGKLYFRIFDKEYFRVVSLQ